MTGLDALLQAILADPADDFARLAYADLCEERGDGDRAEFIRVQLELGRHGNGQLCNACHEVFRLGRPAGSACRCGRMALRRRERELMYAGPAPGDISRWADPLNDLPLEDWSFRRGFVAELTCPWDAFATHHAALTVACPLEAVTLTTVPNVEELWEGGGRYLALQGFPETVAEERAFSIKNALAQVWPGIAFDLPRSHPPLMTLTNIRYRDTPPDPLRSITDGLLRSLGIPADVLRGDANYSSLRVMAYETAPGRAVAAQDFGTIRAGDQMVRGADDLWRRAEDVE